jgi:hypothetical protein
MHYAQRKNENFLDEKNMTRSGKTLLGFFFTVKFFTVRKNKNPKRIINSSTEKMHDTQRIFEKIEKHDFM